MSTAKSWKVVFASAPLVFLTSSLVAGCAATAGSAATDADVVSADADDAASSGSDAAAGAETAAGGDNTITATYADGHVVTFTGGTLGWSGIGHDGTGANAAFMGVLLTEGAASGSAAKTVTAGKHMAMLTLIRSSYPAAATALTPGTYNFVLGADANGVQTYGRVDFIETNWQAAKPGTSAMCVTKSAVQNSGTYAGTIVLTEVSATHVSGTFDTVAKNGSSEQAHVSGSFSADVDAKLGADGPSTTCVQ